MANETEDLSVMRADATLQIAFGVLGGSRRGAEFWSDELRMFDCWEMGNREVAIGGPVLLVSGLQLLLLVTVP